MMERVNIHEAKTYLSRLIEAAAKGEPFIIAKAGKPLVKVVPVDAPTAPSGWASCGGTHRARRFRYDGQEEIEKLFYGDE